MTPAEFVAEAITFPIGKICVVSGPDYNAVQTLLENAATAIEMSTTHLALVYDSRATIIRPVLYQQDVVDAQSWEYISLVADEMVVLVANQFDRMNEKQNSHPISMEYDVVRDIVSAGSVANIWDSQSKKYGITRDLFPFITKLYYYDTRSGEIFFVKDSIPDRP